MANTRQRSTVLAESAQRSVGGRVAGLRVRASAAATPLQHQLTHARVIARAVRHERRAGAHRVSPAGGSPSSRQLSFARLFLARLGTDLEAGRSRPSLDRVIPVAIACLVLVASLLSVAPPTQLTGGIGAVEGAGSAPRITIAGLNNPEAIGAVGGAGLRADTIVGDGTGTVDSPSVPSQGMKNPEASPADGAGVVDGQGPFLADGTLLKPLAVDTSVADGKASLKTYVVRSGDSLTSIAARFGISMMTLWWANDLRAKDELHVGQTLTIPPVTGLVVQVIPGDTLESIAADAHVSPDVIVEYNHLTDRVLIIGQILIIPGGVGDPIPEPSPTPTPVAPRNNGGGSSGSGSTTPVSPPRQYTGGRFTWPVVGGGNYISQYFHYSHEAIDIAADYGTPVVAAASGVVIFSGWKNNGGGYQVWISHGGNLYTDYNHMSSLTVGTGEHVSAGQQVGRIGMTGWATGPHLHFDVWIGMIWADGSYRVNPLNYF